MHCPMGLVEFPMGCPMRVLMGRPMRYPMDRPMRRCMGALFSNGMKKHMGRPMGPPRNVDHTPRGTFSTPRTGALSCGNLLPRDFTVVPFLICMVSGHRGTPQDGIQPPRDSTRLFVRDPATAGLPGTGFSHNRTKRNS